MATVFQLDSLEQQVDRLSLIRYQSYQAADELRQSTGDLTRLGRTDVVTGDENTKRCIWIFLISVTAKAPPGELGHHLLGLCPAIRPKPNPDGQTIALQQMMKDLGFSDREFALLKEAQNNPML